VSFITFSPFAYVSCEASYQSSRFAVTGIAVFGGAAGWICVVLTFGATTAFVLFVAVTDNWITE
jgi:hypothetical protein